MQKGIGKMAIQLIHGDAADFSIAADLIFTDPPFEIKGEQLAKIIGQYQSDHLLMLCSMHQLLDFSKYSDFKLNFDMVIDLVSPKQSKSIHQPFYTHVNLVYMSRNRVKTRFDRRHGQRSDQFSEKYFPSIIRAHRERSDIHGHAKNQQAVKDLLSYFSVSKVVDMFAGTGTTGLACYELGVDCVLIEKDISHYSNTKQTFNFLGENVDAAI